MPPFATRRSGFCCERGQAAVETAIVLPLMTFLVLGMLQLTLVQHARLMTEYAAFNAARAGIVWNGNQCMMRRAAVVSLLPTLQATDTLGGATLLGKHRPGLFQTWAEAQILVEATGAISGILRNLGITDPAVTLIDVDVLNPKSTQYFHDGKELEFDAVAGWDDRGPDFSGHDRMRDAAVLTVRVLYLYPMKIPFANWSIFVSYMATRVGTFVTGDFTPGSVGKGGKSIVDGEGTLADAQAATAGAQETDHGGNRVFGPGTMALLWEVGRRDDVWLFPLEATHSMRMQSNFFASNLGAAGKAGLCVD
ncbi:MAG: pilus assembly protein [Deltaproteobacteria bacterium]|nr:MAG: pilus assembly protein [Deltaproteobacteria bacterium]